MTTRRRRHVGRDEGLMFKAPRGTRFHRYFFGIKVMNGPKSWWLSGPGVWVEDYRDDPRWKTEGATNSAPCRTLRAFRSHLRRHRAELQGCLVVLCSRYHGHDVSVQL